MKSNNKIVFTPSNIEGQQKAPWDKASKSAYEDLIFTDDLIGHQLKLESGPNWFRILPALPDSNHWMLHVSAIAMKHGRFAHPRTLVKGATCVFDRAYRWFAANASDKLFSRKNPKGHRLLCKSLCAFWCLAENNAGKVEAKLFLAPADDGLRGGLSGLGYRIWQKVTATDPEVDVVLDPIHPERGALVCIEKTWVLGGRYPTYQVRVGRQAAPIQDSFDRMEASEFDLLRPIEKTIRELSDDEQWDHLTRVIGTHVTAKIRSSRI